MSKFLWTQRSNYGPSPRAGSALCFDSHRNRTVLFGGSSLTNGLHGDTWEWDGSFWIQLADTGPFARALSAMVYDSTRQISVLFSGIGTANAGDTWQWDGSDWTQLSESGPGARSSHAMAYDTSRSRTILFGGVGDSLLGDTWEFDGEDWTQVQDAGPSARESHCMAYDSVGKRVILFAGRERNNAPLNDTWAWDGQEWIQLGEFGPPPRFSAAMSSTGGTLVLFGGGTASDPVSSQIFADTWEFDGKLWTQVQDIGPGPLQGSSAAFDSARGRAMLFGGITTFIAPDGTKPANSGFTWEAPVTAAVAPPAPVAVASIVVPPNVVSEQPTTMTINLTGPAPQGGAVVNFTGPIVEPDGSGTNRGPVTISAGLASTNFVAAFAGPPGSIQKFTAQIAGTPAVTTTVVLTP